MPVIPYVRATHADGNAWSAAKANQLEAGVNDVSYAPCVAVTHNAAQALGASTETTLAFNTERFDQAGNAADTMHDTVTNNSRLTCRYAGVYLISGIAEFSVNNADQFITFRVNGTTTILRSRETAGVVGLPTLTGSRIWALAVNDYVEMRAFSSTACNVNVNASWSPEFMMVRVA